MGSLPLLLAIIGVWLLVVLWRVLDERRSAAQKPTTSEPLKLEPKPEPDFRFLNVTGRLIGSIWEVEHGGDTFRAYSNIEVATNEWTTKDGRKPSVEQHALFTRAIQAFRASRLDPWSARR